MHRTKKDGGGTFYHNTSQTRGHIRDNFFFGFVFVIVYTGFEDKRAFVCFYVIFKGFLALRIMGKRTGHHLISFPTVNCFLCYNYRYAMHGLNYISTKHFNHNHQHMFTSAIKLSHTLNERWTG